MGFGQTTGFFLFGSWFTSVFPLQQLLQCYCIGVCSVTASTVAVLLHQRLQYGYIRYAPAFSNVNR